MNLNEYMVTLERPLGVRFALSLDGKVFVHSLRKGVMQCFSKFCDLIAFITLLRCQKASNVKVTRYFISNNQSLDE
ncbi:hypothetical protein HPP92_023970 [Vanilla planifolia]|uniref:Uncharacterized protein n=1 Tax=Vanilla planifolia TaxID=51239 RepID=A0A835PRB4_VANPL|nr:hypothetical protein HPP92_023970 [Vanilla planifolia]